MAEAAASQIRHETDSGLGEFIVADWRAAAPAAERPVRFRRSFDLAADVTRAQLAVTACGVFAVEVNGHLVGDHVLDPGWTSYHHRHRVIRHDVSALLVAGANVIGITVAEGWYRGRLGFGGGTRDVYGTEIGPLARLTATHPDGSTTVVETDDAWKAAPGAILSSSLYDGETLDARLLDDWGAPSYDDSSWHPVRVGGFDRAPLFESGGPRVRRIEELRPVAIQTTAAGTTLVDFGQNIAGRVRIEVPADPGRTITLRHAEVLEHGAPSYRPLRLAAATDRIIAGPRSMSWEPQFTIHGFRYAEIEGWPGDLEPDDVRAIVCHTDMAEIGEFECSDPLINRLHENVRWSAKGNFVDIPTDCPQRDERMGWTGDIAVFAPTACFLFDCSSMLESWLQDLAAEQHELGTVPAYVPWIQLVFPPMPNAGWGDAAVIVPWTLYQHFGDPAVLERQYRSMAGWVDLVAERAGERLLWERDWQFGDWLDPLAPSDRPADGRSDPSIVATGFFAHSARLMARTSDVLGRTSDAARYHDLADRVAGAFVDEYVTAGGRLASDSQTAHALALRFGILATRRQRTGAARRLQQLVAGDGHRIGTGFIGTPLVCDALVDGGYADDAYHLLTQTDCPSWLYPVTMGATTVWERWDSMLPDGSVNPGEMTSFNHYALGAIADFLHRRVAGLGPGEPGYSVLDVRPVPGGGLTHARASRRLATGTATVEWQRAGSTFELTVGVPPGVRARVELPDGSPAEMVAEGAHRFRCDHRPAHEDPPRPRPASPFDEIEANQ
jgi:alpha-L-rhamnosidase